jgi:valyl-tRNA synthetase
VESHIKTYRFDLVARDLYEFVWNDYCDWYIELSKPVLYSDTFGLESKQAARHTLINVLEAILRLLHPIMPFITEELWQRVAPVAGVEAVTVMRCRYPQCDSALIDADAQEELEWVKSFIMGVRQIRSEMDIKPGKPVPVLCQHGSDIDQQRIERNRALLQSLAKLDSITWLDGDAQAPQAATSLVGDMQQLIPLAGLIDKDAERARLQKNIDKLEQEGARLSAKLGNENFVARAPREVVDKEKEKLADSESALASLRAQLQRIETI